MGGGNEEVGKIDEFVFRVEICLIMPREEARRGKAGGTELRWCLLWLDLR